MNSSTASTMVPLEVTLAGSLPESTDSPTAPPTGEKSTFSKPCKKNTLTLKRMVYQRVEEDDLFGNFQGTTDCLLPKRLKSEKTVQKSPTEILDWRVSNIRPILESAQVRAQSTTYNEMSIISGNSIALSAIPGNENVSSIKESTRLFEQLATTLNSKRIETMVWELDQTKNHFMTNRDRLSAVLGELDDYYGKRIKDLEGNIVSLDAFIDHLKSLRADRLKSIGILRKKRQEYRGFTTKILERLPSSHHLSLSSDDEE